MSTLDTHTNIDAHLDLRDLELLPDGTRLQLIALALTGPAWSDEHSPPVVAPAGVLLRPGQARQLAAQLLQLAHRAERATTRRTVAT